MSIGTASIKKKKKGKKAMQEVKEIENLPAPEVSEKETEKIGPSEKVDDSEQDAENPARDISDVDLTEETSFDVSEEQESADEPQEPEEELEEEKGEPLNEVAARYLKQVARGVPASLRTLSSNLW